MAAFAPHQQHGSHGAQRGDAGNAAGHPAVGVALDQYEAQRRQCNHAQQVAQGVERARPARRALDTPTGKPQAGQAKRDVDEENAAPAELMNEHAAHQWPGRARHGYDGRPGGQHPGAHLFVVIGVREQAQRAGHEQGCAQALQHAGGDQRVGVRRQAA
ncbi:hypothetical protein D3C73_878600 [compost metagenome]